MKRDTESVDARIETPHNKCPNCGEPKWTTEEDGFEVCAFCEEPICHFDI